VKLLELAASLQSDGSNAKQVVGQLVTQFVKSAEDGDEHFDLEEDIAAWQELSNDIARRLGRDAPLEQ
jgi:DNA helicase-2/ATP-dependent DNA helicase PcrA